MTVYIGRDKISDIGVQVHFKKTNEIDTTDATLSNSNQMLNGVTAYSKGQKYTGNIPVKTINDLTVNNAVIFIPAGCYQSDIQKSVATENLSIPVIQVDTTTGQITSTVTHSNSGFVMAGSKQQTQMLDVKDAADVTVNGKTIVIPNGFYTQQIQKSVADGVLDTPNISVDNATGRITSVVSQSSSGWIDSGASKTATLDMTTKNAATYTPGKTDQTISAGQFLTGTQTIKGEPNLDASRILYPTTIFGVQGNVSVVTYYSGSTVPSDSVGSDGDLYFRS